MSKVKLKRKNEEYRGSNQGQIAWDEYREINWAARDQNTNAKDMMELNQPMNIKSNKKSCCSYIDDKRKIRENVDPLCKKMEDLNPQKMKTELPNDFSAFVFNGKCPSHAAWDRT